MPENSTAPNIVLRSRTRVPADLTHFYVITVVSNPQRFRRRFELYFKFAQQCEAAGVGGDNHFIPGYMVVARALNADGSYFPEGALLTFAQAGSYHPDFILPETPNMVLRKMIRTFLPAEHA